MLSVPTMALSTVVLIAAAVLVAVTGAVPAPRPRPVRIFVSAVLRVGVVYAGVQLAGHLVAVRIADDLAPRGFGGTAFYFHAASVPAGQAPPATAGYAMVFGSLTTLLHGLLMVVRLSALVSLAMLVPAAVCRALANGDQVHVARGLVQVTATGGDERVWSAPPTWPWTRLLRAALVLAAYEPLSVAARWVTLSAFGPVGGLPSTLAALGMVVATAALVVSPLVPGGSTGDRVTGSDASTGSAAGESSC